jgi:FkbM family methyltransferase
MINLFVKKILIFFDFFHKKKIIQHIKKNISKDTLNTILDVGAHEGESIELFLNNFNVNDIYSFEPSPDTYQKLTKNIENLKKKFKNSKIHLEKLAVGNYSKNVELNYLNETSSSTLRDLNTNSNYFKKKEQFFGKLINQKMTVEQINFEEYLEKRKIEKVDLLKIDTEGYELEVIKGLNNSISKVSAILFEHHYDNMIIKNYTFSDINELLNSKGFRRVYKIKMPFRKSFDYIYIKE